MIPEKLESDFSKEAIEFDRGGFARRVPTQPVRDGAPESRIADKESRYRIPVQEEHFQLKSDLKASLVRYAHIERLSSLFDPEPEDVIIAYQDTTSALSRMQEEWFTFLRPLVRIDITRIGYLGRESDILVSKAVERCMREIFSKPEMSPARVFSPFTAEIASGSVSEIKQIAIASAEQLASDFVDRMTIHLDCLLNNCVCGIVSRHSNQVCEYFYGFRKLIVDTNRPEGSRATAFMHETATERVSAGILSVVTSASAQFTVCFERHHLIHVIETDPDAGMVHVPRFQRQVIDSIPAWLRPSVRLIEGTLIGRQLIEHDQVPEQISREVHSEFLEAVYKVDPAVILGQFVLTGWGPSEIAEDLAFIDALSKDAGQGGTANNLTSRLRRAIRLMAQL